MRVWCGYFVGIWKCCFVGDNERFMGMLCYGWGYGCWFIDGVC